MTGIPDEAVTALRDAMNEWECGDLCDDRLRAGLAAALPHLLTAEEAYQRTYRRYLDGEATIEETIAAHDALRASQPDRGTSDGASEGRSAVSVALSGLQGHSAPTSNPTDTTQED